VIRPDLAAVVGNLRYRRLQRRLAAPRLLRAFAAAHPEAFFVEIGSNDGEQHDHLRPQILARGWRGIMVEPVPHVFARLRRNYGALADRVALENVAVAGHDGTMPFFYPAPPGPDELAGLPDWYDGIGSLSREAVLAHAHRIPDIAARLVEAEVPCLTYRSLLERHRVARVDLVVIDTEGSDWDIVRTLPLDADRPRLLVYEHFHLRSEDRRACLAHVRAAGYETMEEGFDTFCLDPSADDELTAVWRRLRPALPGVSAEDEVR
jgi:FkbM family methyltransferase